MSGMLYFPTSIKEMRARGWTQADVVLFTGDAYVDHPSFGAAVIARVLEHAGYDVAIVPQPNWRDDLRDFRKLGRPRLFFGVTSGNMDSMINHYTANKRLRSNDAFTPGNLAGQRPDYAVTVYSNILRSLFPDVPIVLGGIEASLRRLTHYDYWSDSLKPSVLVDAKADLLAYGMAEQSIIEIAGSLKAGMQAREIIHVPQTAYIAAADPSDNLPDPIMLASFEECATDKNAFARNFVFIEQESNSLHQKHLIERTGDRWIVVNPSYPPLTEQQLDTVYGLPYTRLPHPRYDGKEPIPAFEMIKDSVTLHRGCFGGCSFCTISAHQGKFISFGKSRRSLRLRHSRDTSPIWADRRRTCIRWKELIWRFVRRASAHRASIRPSAQTSMWIMHRCSRCTAKRGKFQASRRSRSAAAFAMISSSTRTINRFILPRLRTSKSSYRTMFPAG
jgi:uncharacterized radical SAM protein YgiQ